MWKQSLLCELPHVDRCATVCPTVSRTLQIVRGFWGLGTLCFCERQPAPPQVAFPSSGSLRPFPLGSRSGKYVKTRKLRLLVFIRGKMQCLQSVEKNVDFSGTVDCMSPVHPPPRPKCLRTGGDSGQRWAFCCAPSAVKHKRFSAMGSLAPRAAPAPVAGRPRGVRNGRPASTPHATAS